MDPARPLVHLHVFCSAKGGVGKSTLAVACADLLAEDGHQSLLVDADLTGTSLADGLCLRAPRLPVRPDGTLDIEGEPDGFYSVEESRRLRQKRWYGTDLLPRHVPFFNDALTFDAGTAGHECRIDSLVWRHERNKTVAYLPSSSAHQDVQGALGWLFRTEHPLMWVRRFTWLLQEALQRMASLRHVIIDLPPGLFGFAREMLVLLPALRAGKPLPDGYAPLTGAYKWRINPFLVTSGNRNDLFVAMEYLGLIGPSVPELLLLLNRQAIADDRLARELRTFFQDDPSLVGLEERMHEVAELRATLGQLFRIGHLDLDKEVRQLRAELRIRPEDLKGC